MDISIDFSMCDTSARVSKSADSLDSALSQIGKIFPHLGETVDSAPLYTVPAVQGGNGFDEWLAADFSSLGGTSSSEDSSASSSPLSVLDDSPLLGFDSFSTMTGTSLLDMSMAFPTLTPEVAPLVTLLTPAPAPMVDGMPLTSLAVQQAAAALNIPWTPSLERALMTQAALQAAAVAVSANATVAVAPLSQAMPLPLIKDEAIPLALPVPMAAPKEPSVAPFVAAPVAPVTAAASADSEPAPVHRVVMRGKGSKKRCLSIEEEQEEIVTKRAKNTDAARRSRLKKLLRLEGLEAKADDLETANHELSMKIAVLETERNGFMAKEAERAARIAQLEEQLAEAHATLSSRS